MIDKLPSYEATPPRRRTQPLNSAGPAELAGSHCALRSSLGPSRGATAVADAGVTAEATLLTSGRSRTPQHAAVERKAQRSYEEVVTLEMDNVPLPQAPALSPQVCSVTPPERKSAPRLGWTASPRVLPGKRSTAPTPVMMTPVSPLEPSGCSRAHKPTRAPRFGRDAAWSAWKNDGVEGGVRRVVDAGEEAPGGQQAHLVRCSELNELPVKTRARLEVARQRRALRPAFRALPEPFLWPSPEMNFFMMFPSSLVQSACAVLGAACAGYYVLPGTILLSLGAIALVVAFYASEARRICIFKRTHNDQLWSDADPPGSKEEVDDALIALLVNATTGLVPPAARELGGFEAPQDDEVEPARTERAFARAATLPWRRERFGDWASGAALLELSTWLGGASGSGPRGLWYLYAISVAQLLLAALIGGLSVVSWAQVLRKLAEHRGGGTMDLPDASTLGAWTLLSHMPTAQSTYSLADSTPLSRHFRQRREASS